MRQIKQCTKRTKKGRCTKLGHACCFLPLSLLTACPWAGEKTKAKRGRKKK